MASDHRPALGLTAGAVGVAAALGYWLPSAALVSRPLRQALGVRATVDAPGAVALTFDDGPHPEGTPAILELLRAGDVPATFFLAAEQVVRYPALAAEIAAAGHAIGVHCLRHRNLMRLTPGQVADDLARAAEAIAAATGVSPGFYRPPYGILTTAAVRAARRHGWETVLWRRDGADWQARTTPERIARKILGRLEPGDVILLHDADWYSAPGSWRRTAAALEIIVGELGSRRLKPVLI